MSFSIDEFGDKGFVKLTDSMSHAWCLNFLNWSQLHMEADRGHDAQGNYIAKPKTHVNWANWWSQDLTNLDFIDNAVKFYMPHISRLLDNPVLYHSDLVVTTNRHQGVRPHIDTPYRFESFSEEERLLGVQCLIPLTSFTRESGGTAFVPGSHNTQWDIKRCYRGEYNDYFMEHYEQPELKPGEMLLWHPRVLHSAMPNTSVGNRTAALLLFVEREYYDEIRVIDNIFK